MRDKAARLQKQIADKEWQLACLIEDSQAQSRNRLHVKALRNQLELAEHRARMAPWKPAPGR